MAGVWRLTLTEFNAYCVHHGLSRSEAQDLWFYILVLDRVYAAFKNEKAEKKPA